MGRSVLSTKMMFAVAALCGCQVMSGSMFRRKLSVARERKRPGRGTGARPGHIRLIDAEKPAGPGRSPAARAGDRATRARRAPGGEAAPAKNPDLDGSVLPCSGSERVLERIAFYGKGGIGKSTIATGASLTLARSGQRVLHVGCDPKHDSSLVLVKDPVKFKTVMDKVFADEPVDRDDLIMEGINGIDCVEAGGPEAGRGCGGRAVSRAFEIFDEVDLVDSRYDTVVYDVLGDVVCGGFAAPMRRSAGSKVCVVLSEEMMAAYAANRIAAAVREFADNGIVLAGLVLNLRSNRADLTPIRRFAEALNTQVLGVLPRDPLVCEAELYRKSIVEYAPESPVPVGIRAILAKVHTLDRANHPVPTPLPDIHVRTIMRGYDVTAVEPPPPRERPQSTITEWSQI